MQVAPTGLARPVAGRPMGRPRHAQGRPAGRPFLVHALGLLGLTCWPLVAGAAPLAGTRNVVLHSADGAQLVIGQVAFTPGADGVASFALKVDHGRFTDHFLSMREFKCVEGRGEILCHVPYPYPQPGWVSTADLAWLEHALLFMFKLPGDFGAKLWNGVYFRLQPAPGGGLVGTPQAVDLNLIGAPPARPEVPPYGPARRDDIRPGARWFERLTIE